MWPSQIKERMNAVRVVYAVFSQSFFYIIIFTSNNFSQKYSIYSTTLLVKPKNTTQIQHKSNTNITQLQQLQRWAMDTDGKTGYGITQNTELQF